MVAAERVSPTAGEVSAGVKSLAKALRLLRFVAEAERPPTVAEAATGADISRGTAYRMVQTLIAESYLMQDDYGRLSVGFAVLPLAGRLLDGHRLRVESLPHLQSLAERTGERVNLGLLYRDRVLYLAGVEKPSLPTIYTRFGKSAPAHCCSLGKAILAYLPEDQVEALVKRTGLTGGTPKAITSLARLKQDLSETRLRGYAIDREEHLRASYCLGVPILNSRNEPISAISVSGNALEPLLAELEHLKHTAELISHLPHS